MFEHMILLDEFETEIEADIVCGHLKAAGIGAIVVKDDAGGMLPSLQQGGRVRLLVPEEQKATASRILDVTTIREKK